MQFLGVGWQEMMVIFVIALIFVGPERMPQVAYQIGRAVRTLQSYARAVRNEFSEEISYVEEQYKTVRGEIDTARKELNEQQRQFNAEMREATAPLQELSTVTSEASNILNFPETPAVAALPAPEPEVPAAPPPDEKPVAPPLVF